jgi:hypothetical protein
MGLTTTEPMRQTKGLRRNLARLLVERLRRYIQADVDATEATEATVHVIEEVGALARLQGVPIDHAAAAFAKGWGTGPTEPEDA